MEEEDDERASPTPTSTLLIKLKNISILTKAIFILKQFLQSILQISK